MLETICCLGICGPILAAVMVVIGIGIDEFNDWHNAWRKKRWAKKGK